MLERYWVFVARQVVLAILIIVGVFVVSTFYFNKFYILQVNSDSAFNFVLGDVIAKSHQLFPKDIWFGNDVFLLRPQFVIAIVRLLPVPGFAGFAIACSITIAVCFYLVFLSLFKLCRLSVVAALLATTFVFLPFGLQESEFVLGEQSHLQQTTVSLVGFCALTRWLRAPTRFSLVLSLLCPFLLAWDSPQRGLLAAVGVAVILAPSFLSRRSVWLIALAILAMTGAGLAANAATTKLISRVGVSDYLTINAIEAATSRLLQQVHFFFGQFVGVDDLAGLHLGPVSLVILVVKLSLALVLLASAIYLSYRYIRAWSRAEPATLFETLNAAGVAMALCGVFIVSFSQFDCDIRHYLPALIIIKCAFVLFIIEEAAARRAIRLVVCLSGPLLVLISPPVTASILGRNDSFYSTVGERQAVAKAIKTIVAANHWSTPIALYGTYWNSSVYDFFLDGVARSAPIDVEAGNIKIYKWLSQPTRYCQPVPSLLLVAQDEHDLAAALKGQDATKVASLPFHDLYLIKPDVIVDCRKRADRKG